MYGTIKRPRDRVDAWCGHLIDKVGGSFIPHRQKSLNSLPDELISCYSHFRYCRCNVSMLSTSLRSLHVTKFEAVVNFYSRTVSENFDCLR